MLILVKLHSSMFLFQVFKIVQMLPNRAKHHRKSSDVVSNITKDNKDDME